MPYSSAPYGPRETNEAAEFIAARIGDLPRTAILAGTGLGEMADAFQVREVIDYRQIPHFPVSTVQSHAGRWVAGTVAGRPVALLQGRFHLYEGYSPRAVTFPIRVLQALGVKTIVLTNAAGGLNTDYDAGDIMIVSDHLNLTGANPLIGPDEVQWGPRFPDMTRAYDSRLSVLALDEARSMGVVLHQGIYAGLKGPSLETPAEMRFLRSIGADAVGFSTVMETIAAVHGGIRVLGLSTITNMCLPDAAAPATVEDIIAVAQAAAPRLGKLIGAVLAKNDDGS